MGLIITAISIFIILESLNVMILYFTPKSKRGNGVGVFKAIEKSKEIPEVHRLIKYLINWVAGTKLIFIGLLLLILIKGDLTMQILSILVLILTILTFFWRLFPLLKVMDERNELEPKGYSRKLSKLIVGIVLLFVFVLVLTYVKK